MLWELIGNQLRYSNTHHRQTQGAMVEGMNAVVGQMLKCMIHRNRSSNKEYLSLSIRITINSLQNSSVSCSPFHLVHGYYLSMPIKLIKGDGELKIKAVSNFVEWVQSI